MREFVVGRGKTMRLKHIAPEFFELTTVDVLDEEVSRFKIPLHSLACDILRRAEFRHWSISGESLFWSLYVERIFSKKELLDSDLLLLEPTRTFIPAGTDCGTEYFGGCEFCKLGREVKGYLRLDTRKIPASVDIAQSVSQDEVVVSGRFAELLYTEAFDQVQLDRIEDRRLPDGTTDLRKTPSGRKLLKNAELAGIKTTDAAFLSLINTDVNARLFDQSVYEWDAKLNRRSKKPLPTWHHLRIAKATLSISSQDCYGDSPFISFKSPSTHCPREHILGIKQLKKLSVKPLIDNSSFAIQQTIEGCGKYFGTVVPHRPMVIDQKFYRLMLEAEIRGYSVEAIECSR